MTKFLLVYGKMQPTRDHLDRLVALDDGVELAVAENQADAVAHAADADLFLGHRYLQRTLPAAKKVVWIQSLLAGVDHLATPALFLRNPQVTRCPIFSDVIAVHAVTMAYSLVRRLPEAARQQAQGIWRLPADLLPMPTRALILGLGAIGREIARILRALGVFVRGVAKSWSAEKAAAVDEFVPTANWRSPLSDSDLCFVALPATKETSNMIDRQALAVLPRHAVLVNVGRGQVVDTEALVETLAAGQLGGAALDVIEPKPAGPDDPVWQTPRLLITPHMASFTPQRQERVERFVEEQVARFLQGEPLLYPVDLAQLRRESTRPS